MIIDPEKIINAFPQFLKNDVLSLLNKISLKSQHPISDAFDVIVNGEKLQIPYRIYIEEPHEMDLSETELLILNCLFTRHHDGFTRQQRLERILSSGEYWTTPFIVRLLGEYVIEILFVIDRNLSDKWIDNLKRFTGENEGFFETTKRRVVSYWDCYYRCSFKLKDDYVGFQILKKLEKSIEK